MVADDSRQPVFDDIPPRPSKDVANKKNSHSSAGVPPASLKVDGNTRELAGCYSYRLTLAPDLSWCETSFDWRTTDWLTQLSLRSHSFPQDSSSDFAPCGYAPQRCRGTTDRCKAAH